MKDPILPTGIGACGARPRKGDEAVGTEFVSTSSRERTRERGLFRTSALSVRRTRR